MGRVRERVEKGQGVDDGGIDDRGNEKKDGYEQSRVEFGRYPKRKCEPEQNNVLLFCSALFSIRVGE